MNEYMLKFQHVFMPSTTMIKYENQVPCPRACKYLCERLKHGTIQLKGGFLKLAFNGLIKTK
jgi:hypothetical protein